MLEDITIKTYIPQPKQVVYHKAPQRNKLYGGAMGGGKSRTLCEELNRQMFLYPGNRGLLLRKVFADFKISTYVILKDYTIKEFIANGLVKENKQEKFFMYWNGSRLDYGGLQLGEGTSDREKNKYFSTEYGCIGIDEAREVSEKEFKDLGTRLRHRLSKTASKYDTVDSLGEKRPPYHMLLASNPSQNWLKNRFILGPNPKVDIFVPALPVENKYNPPDYEAQLLELFKGDEKMIQAFIRGSWDSVGSIDDLVTMEEIQACIGMKYVSDSELKRNFTVCDPARFGDDRTVIYDFEDYVVKSIEEYGKKDTMETVGRLLIHQSTNDSDMVGVDSIFSPGICDRLSEIAEDLVKLEKPSFQVEPIDFREGSDDPKYFNLRTQIYWNLRNKIKGQQIPIPPNRLKLYGQLCATKYKFVGGKKGTQIQIKSKDEVKAITKSSPDEADTFAMGIYLYDLAPVKKKKVPGWMSKYKEQAGASAGTGAMAG